MRIEKIELKVGELPDGTPLFLRGVFIGNQGGPVVALSSSIHGVEVNGFEVMRRLYLKLIEVKQVDGGILLLPMISPLAVAMRSIVNPLDSMNLNRVFPGRTNGILTERIAFNVIKVIRDYNVECLVDFHGGGYCCESAPHVAIVDVDREDLLKRAIDLASAMGFKYVAVLRRIELEEELRLKATLDAAAMRMGIPSLLADFGSWGYQHHYIEFAVQGLMNMLRHLGVLRGPVEERQKPIIVERAWIRANEGGMFYPAVKLLDHVSNGDLLGKIINPCFEVVEEVKSSHEGVVLLIRTYPPVFTGEEVAMIGVSRSDNS